jgi:probable phosphoglycerate mutase
MADIQKIFPEEWENRGKNIGTFRPPKGESFSDLAKRVLPAFYKLCTESLSHMLIIAHAGVNRVILADIMHLDFNALLQIPQDYSAGNLIEMTHSEIKILHINQLPYN